MNYLVNLLFGDPENTVKGLTLGYQNYVIARDLLSKRFGDNRALISAHMRKLLSLDPIFNILDIKALRTL